MTEPVGANTEQLASGDGARATGSNGTNGSTHSKRSTRSTTELLRDVVTDARDLIQEEAALARAELKQAIGHRAIGAGAMAFAGVGGFLALVFASLAIAAGIAVALPAWAAALIVAGIWLVAAGLAALVGRAQMKRREMQETKRTLQEDVQWAKEHLRSSRSTGSDDAWTKT